jgi:hypothetical protein
VHIGTTENCADILTKPRLVEEIEGKTVLAVFLHLVRSVYFEISGLNEDFVRVDCRLARIHLGRNCIYMYDI